METDKFKTIISELTTELQSYQFDGDLADIGDVIGRVIGKYIDKKDFGYEYETFIAGLQHGISIADGTHF